MAIVLPKLSRRRPSARRAADTPPALSVSLCRDDARYAMGQSLTARWQIGELAAEQIEGVEASVLWYTEGKGGEDLHVHAFRRWSDADLRQFDITQPRRLRCDLPLSPLSYEGTLLRIRWCVRLRLFRSCGRDIVAEAPFQLVHQLSQAGDSVSRPVITHLAQRDSVRNDLPELAGRLS